MTTRSGMTVAVAQLAGARDLETNLRAIERMSAEAAAGGAELVVFPEAVMYDFTASSDDIRAAARQADDFEARITAAALRSQIAIVVGLYKPGSGDLVRNVSVAIGPDGARLGEYQKLHLFDAFSHLESSKSERAPLQPGFGELVTFQLGAFRFGLLICYDIRFPEISRLLVDRGADVLIVSSAWVTGPRKELHWETLLRTRAIENTCFLAASGQPAPVGTGMSMIIDPNGIVTAAVAADEGIAIARLERSRLDEVRRQVPCLEHRRYRVTAAE